MINTRLLVKPGTQTGPPNGNGQMAGPLRARAITLNHYYFVRYPYDSCASF